MERAAAWREHLDACRGKGLQVGLVPTMGALHAGHMSLIRRAAGECDVVAVTDYVNPLQFGPAEDLSSYPRDLENDRRLAEEAGADVLFAPSSDQMWPRPPTTSIRVEGLTEHMEGASRPGHFEGVATIVAKLFSLSGACWAYFGEKDFQQLAVIRRMVSDLSLPVEVISCPTVRDTNGLALSSRNAYLTEEEHALAHQLFWALLTGKRAIEDDGLNDPAKVSTVMAAGLEDEPRWRLDYAEVVDPDTLETPNRIEAPVRLLMAARLGAARLIDNVEANPPNPTDA